ncbi:MAG: vWA domain-containing protein, partial [Actinomycetota bacterium]
ARLVLVLDRSGSMIAETPDRIDRLKTAALDFVNLAENGVELGLVSFSTVATDEEPIAALGADRSDYTDAINALVASGRTNIGDGLQHAKDMIAAAGGVTGNTAIILMTDGVNNEPLPDPATDLQSKIDMLLMQGIPVYVTCTGGDLGLDSQCAEIAAGTLGTYVDSESGASLPPAFGLFHELVMGRQIGATMEGNFIKPETYMVMVEPNVTTATFLLQWQDANAEGQLLVTDPSGVDYLGMPIPQGEFVRVSDPMPGDWRVMVSSLAGQSVPSPWVSRAFLQNQNLMFGGHLRMRKVEPGEPFVIYGHPLYGGPIGPVTVNGMVTKPDGSMVAITLVDTGQVTDSGDDLADDGVHTATFTDTAMRGAYSFHLRAVALNPGPLGHTEGPPITAVQIPNHIREVTLSGTVNDRVGSEICNGNAYGEAGTDVEVPLVLDTGEDVAGFQVDMLYNP